MKTRKLISAAILLSFLASPAWASDYYFSSSTGNNSTGAGTIGSPWADFNAKKGTAGALSCGDTINLKRGDTWTGSAAQIIVRSGTTSCSDSNPITIQAYGTGANPILAGAASTTAGWSLHSGSIYKITGQSQTHLKTVVQGDDNKALFYWSGSNTTLPAGTFRRESTTLYVRRWDSADPSSAGMRIGSFSATADADGSRGLVSAGSRADGATYGHYVHFRDLTIIGANGVGFSYSGTHGMDAGLAIYGAGADGFLAYSDLLTSHENGDYFESYGINVSYSAAGANGGGGYGQGMTSYSSFGYWIYSTTQYNAMAGMDWLNFGPSTNVTESVAMWPVSHHNGLAQTDPSYDGNFYVDGATKVFVYGLVSYANGVGSGTAGNDRSSFKIGSEHPSTDPASDVYVINGLFYGNNWLAFETDNASSSTANIKNITVAYNTMIAQDAGSFDPVFNLADMDTTADNYRFYNNIFISDSQYVSAYMTTASLFDADHNLYYKRATASSSTSIYHTCSTCSGTAYSLAGWQSASGEDASSTYGDPLLVTDSDSSTDAHLGGGSPAINLGQTGAYTVPSWLPTTIKDFLGTQGIRGTTIAAGTIDNYATAPDSGVHYGAADLTSTNVEPASLVQSAAGNVTVSFTIPRKMAWMPYNGKIDVIFPAGFTLSSGGTTSAGSLSGISGTVSTGISGQTVTVTRTGDGNSEFPGSFSFVLSNVLNSASTGSTGTYTIRVKDSAGTILAEDTAVSADTIIAAGGGGQSYHFSCSGPITTSGRVTLS